MIRYAVFFLVILLANIIQGITGFAGTILAMPPSLMLVGYGVAKPVLNVLGLLSGVYVFVGNREHVNWKELRRIVLVMAVGIVCGVLIRDLFAGKEQILYRALGVFVILLAVLGLRKLLRPQKEPQKPQSSAAVLILPLAGVVHGIFVSGGPLLISYLTRRIDEKVSFRATISTVWIFLNSLILLDDIRAGLWSASLLKTQLISIPFLFAGMYIGSLLVKRMSQALFMRITYILLLISGVSLLVK